VQKFRSCERFDQLRSVRTRASSVSCGWITPSWLRSKREKHRQNGPAARSHSRAMSCCGVALWQMAAECNPSQSLGHWILAELVGKARQDGSRVSQPPEPPPVSPARGPREEREVNDAVRVRGHRLGQGSGGAGAKASLVTPPAAHRPGHPSGPWRSAQKPRPPPVSRNYHGP
jgi:hypothetical protein